MESMDVLRRHKDITGESVASPKNLCSTKPNNVPANRATDTGEFKKQSLKSDILFSPVQSGVLPESSSQRGSETYVGRRYIRVVDGDVDDKDDDGNFSFPL